MARAPVSKTGYWGSSPYSPAICPRAADGETEPTQNRLRRYTVSSNLTVAHAVVEQMWLGSVKRRCVEWFRLYGPPRGMVLTVA